MIKQERKTRMSLGKKLQVRLTDNQFIAIQQIAIYLNTDISSVIRSAIDDAIITMNRWTDFDLESEPFEPPKQV